MNFFEVSSPDTFAPSAAFELSVDDFYRVLKAYQVEAGISIAPEPISFQNPSPEDFRKSFTEIMNLISQGQVQKAVPVVFAQSVGSMNVSLKLHCLLNLLKADSALYPFGFWNEGSGVIGATPEILFDLDEGRLSTMALAGTMARGEGKGAGELLRSQKDLKEHQFVSADILNVLSPIGAVKYFGPTVLELPHLYHLLTRFQVQLNTQMDPEKLVRLLHPTPALGVAPRVYGWQWLKQLPEQKTRGVFGAPILFKLGSSKALCLVAIRQIQWDESSLRLGSGCGIVSDSDLDKEWDELSKKRQSVRNLLGI